ncbi:MAG: O-acetyl-ADP-ribose deacetylase [Candidatus Omnitrophica bacterium]|nr:O-acetyl-ADP-ribose deacetylase [Candidatus Omnitrophota bacterium]MBI3021323.1 O-acetyl-ADP-ribose deacetylase [Candidatus Omnitrophota bacterium]MBI3083187.1 O-acetyl-ADP-ribose deacetylase [Candidatus Omnitrophota bacterium]
MNPERPYRVPQGHVEGEPRINAPAETIGTSKLELAQGDITQQETEAIGNAANSRLAGGGGVDGAIHRAGGPSIMQELRAKYPQGCPTGQAVITGGGRLKARYVLHAVGPVYSGKPKDAELLASAYRSCLTLCSQHGIRTVAFPAISTGVYRYPVEEAAPIAIRAVADYLKTHPEITLVRFVLFDPATYQAYRHALATASHRV